MLTGIIVGLSIYLERLVFSNSFILAELYYPVLKEFIEI